jgi:hypothetical protein
MKQFQDDFSDFVMFVFDSFGPARQQCLIQRSAIACRIDRIRCEMSVWHLFVMQSSSEASFYFLSRCFVHGKIAHPEGTDEEDLLNSPIRLLANAAIASDSVARS